MTQPTIAPTRIRIVGEAPQIVERVTIRTPHAARGYLVRPDPQWSPTDLRDYVLTEIERRLPPGVAVPRNPAKEVAIFKGFLNRWPQGVAVQIARLAFTGPDNGWWRGAPIRVERFCAANDLFFALPLAERLAEAQDLTATAEGRAAVG